MANVKLPKQIDPVKSAQKQSMYDGRYLAHEMTRFSSAVASVGESVFVKVEFAKDAQSLTYFKGDMNVNVQLICQRCNKPFNHSVYTEFCFTPVQGNEEEDLLPDAYEPVEVNDHGEVDIFQAIEDELILALPIVPLHAEEVCNVGPDDMTFGKIEPEQERKNPFAVLKELKRD